MLGADAFTRFGDEIDRGDWVGVEGTVMKTKLGELSVNVSSYQLLSKALRPLPEKWHGLSDTDTRYRQRYVDLIANDDARRVFDIRFAAIAAMRRFLAERGYVEVETPVLHPISGGATARPFATHHNALDVDVFLRIAPELYLKRLIVGGYDRVFEFARVFRNEGLSTRHNPEFTMLELYEAFADYYDMMRLHRGDDRRRGARRDRRHASSSGTAREIDLTPPFQRRTLIDLVREHAGVDVHPSQPVEELRAICDRFEVPWEPSWRSGQARPGDLREDDRGEHRRAHVRVRLPARRLAARPHAPRRPHADRTLRADRARPRARQRVQRAERSRSTSCGGSRRRRR